MKRLLIAIIGVFSCLHYEMHADVVGSDSVVSVLPHYAFSASPAVANRIASFGWAQNGFSLENSTTSVLFDSIYPVSGTITLNNGTLNLNRDLIFNNPTTFTNFGTIVGNNHILSLSQSIVSIPANAPTFQDTKIVLHNDVKLTGKTYFNGTCSIEGNGYTLTLGNAASIILNGQLLMHNVMLDGVAGNNVKCKNDSSLFIFDDVTWIQTDDFSMVVGAFQCRNCVTFKGPHLFAYQTLKTSLIKANATLLLDHGFTFSYDPVRLASKTLLAFADSTASLVLNSATLCATTTGLNLTKGSLFVAGDSSLCSDVITNGTTIIDNGITFGDGQEANDFSCTVATGARLSVTDGSVNYKNVLSSSWNMQNSLSMLNMGVGTILRLFATLDLGYGQTLCDDNVTIARVSTAQILGNVSAVNNLFFEQM
ncbi:MAG: hypothetical protein NTX86_00195 [Candidatus Dependentiae bacterium]|nr:hypothetical protein [Candidatus Dependentiae bacterium]